MAYLTNNEMNNLNKVAQTLCYFDNKRQLDNEEQTTYMEFLSWLEESERYSKARSAKAADYIRERRKEDKNYARGKRHGRD